MRFRLLWVAVAALAAVGAAAVVVGAESDSFDDDGGVHEPSINRLSEAGVLEGTECGERRVCPDDPLLRWVMAVWVTRALNQAPEGSEVETRFADVDPAVWWVSYVERLADLGVTSGCKTGPLRYCPDQPVTRAQMATFLVRALDLEAAPAAGFADTGGNTHEANIDALAAAGVTSGCKTGPLRYCPDQPVTRAQMATFLVRALDLEAPVADVGFGGFVGRVVCGGGTARRLRPGPVPSLDRRGRGRLRHPPRSVDRRGCDRPNGWWGLCPIRWGVGEPLRRFDRDGQRTRFRHRPSSPAQRSVGVRGPQLGPPATGTVR